jgi:hypothetical protein
VDTPSERPLLDKLGLRPEMRVSLLRFSAEPGFAQELLERGADVSNGVRRGSNLIFLRVGARADLGRLASLEPWIERNGAVWIVYPKGRTDLKETDVIAAGLAAGLVDNKVVRFSDTHTALRFVIPVARR